MVGAAALAGMPLTDFSPASCFPRLLENHQSTGVPGRKWAQFRTAGGPEPPGHRSRSGRAAGANGHGQPATGAATETTAGVPTTGAHNGRHRRHHRSHCRSSHHRSPQGPSKEPPQEQSQDWRNLGGGDRSPRTTSMQIIGRDRDSIYVKLGSFKK